MGSFGRSKKETRERESAAVISSSAIALHRVEPSREQAARTPPYLRGTRVLVVDDDPDARATISMTLLDAGAQVVEAESVAEALTVLQITHVDVIVSDIGMPSEDGYALLRAVRSDATTRRVPALALTAFAREVDRARAVSAGFDDHAAKPIDPEALVQRVAALARREGRASPRG